jgi:hypothetical protein
VKKLKVKKKKKIPAPHGRCCLKKKRISRWWLMIILSLFFSYRSWVLFPPLGEICTSLRHNQHTSNNLHLHTPGPAAEWWIVQVCKNKKQKKTKKTVITPLVHFFSSACVK